ncbi:MAG TPA: hypothetical protein VGC02_01355, partial [Methanobacterium sp.]
MNLTKHLGWRVRLGLLLVIISALLYLLNFIIFNDPHDLFFYISIHTAFLPIEVLFVVLVIETAISEREKSILIEKLNMVIGTFFSEIGTELLKKVSKFDSKTYEIRQTLVVTDEWSEKEFKAATKTIKNYSYSLEIDGEDQAVEFLQDLKAFLKNKRPFLLALL